MADDEPREQPYLPLPQRMGIPVQRKPEDDGTVADIVHEFEAAETTRIGDHAVTEKRLQQLGHELLEESELDIPHSPGDRGVCGDRHERMVKQATRTATFLYNLAGIVDTISDGWHTSIEKLADSLRREKAADHRDMWAAIKTNERALAALDKALAVLTTKSAGVASVVGFIVAFLTSLVFWLLTRK